VAISAATAGRRFALIDGLMTAHVENEKTALATLSRDEQEQLDRLLGKWLAGR